MKTLQQILDSNASKLAYLASRWNDEKEYENFADYVTEIRKMVPSGYEFVKASKRPFGFIFKHIPSQASFRLKATTAGVVRIEEA